jgi:hypothetical protein
MESFKGGDVMSSATKGTERELFVRSFLAQVFAPMHRFGTGDITDAYQERSGQVDIVVPFPETALSFPLYPEGPRLFLAEGVAAVIEVKSDVANQWGEVLSTAEHVKKLRRRFRRQNIATMVDHLERELERPGADADHLDLVQRMKQEAAVLASEPGERIPVFAVGFRGWKTRETLQEKLKGSPVDAVLVLDSMFFESGEPYLRTSSGVWSLMALLEVIEQELNRTVTRDSAAYSYRIAAGFQRNRDAHAAESQDGDGVTHTAAALDEAPNLPLVGKEPRD